MRGFDPLQQCIKACERALGDFCEAGIVHDLADLTCCVPFRRMYLRSANLRKVQNVILYQ